MEASIDDYLFHHDPVKKAERALKKVKPCLSKVLKTSSPSNQSTQLSRPSRSGSSSEFNNQKLPNQTSSSHPSMPSHPSHFKRTPLTAAQKHAVFLRDQGRCTHVDSAGRRCNQDRWVEVHHLTPVSQGGSNEPENLTTLCGFHHDLVHQLTLPLDHQVTWLRSPKCTYG
jgi:5-methylcytosine-specific restriction endonuclease McrA